MPREFADPYVYPGTDVLRNKPGFRDEGALRAFEYEQTTDRAAELSSKPITGKFDLDHLKAIHKHLFQDVYAWAGEVRTVNISKDAIGFAPASYIESYGRTVAADLAKENHLKGLDKPKFVERLANHFTEFNVLHPFREGNGRSTREFVGQLARNAGYELDQTRIDSSKDQWNQASARGRAGDLKPLDATLHEGKDVPAPAMKVRDRGASDNPRNADDDRSRAGPGRSRSRQADGRGADADRSIVRVLTCVELPKMLYSYAELGSLLADYKQLIDDETAACEALMKANGKRREQRQI